MMRQRWLILLLVGAIALAGCGREVGGDDPGATDEPDTDTDTGEDEEPAVDDEDAGDDEPADDSTEASGVACEVDEIDGDLLFYNWSEYMDPDLITAFEDTYDVTVTEDFYTSNEALIAQIRAGGADYDVIVPSDYMVEIMIGEGMLLELDTAAIPNAGNVDADFVDPPYDPGMRFSLPYQWGTTGLGVDLEATGPDPEPTWGWVFDPDMAGELPGRISILDDPREGMAAALYYLGYSPNTQDEGELQEAADLVEQAGAWTVTYTSDQYAELLLTGETVVGHGYSGNFLDSFWEAEDPERYDYLIPEEGATIWTDNMAILTDASSPCTAHTFLNFILDAENGAQLTNWTYYASPNEAAFEFIDEEVTEDPAIYPDEDVQENLFFLENTGDAEILYTDLFTRAQG